MNARLIELVTENLVMTNRSTSDRSKYLRACGKHIRISRGVYVPRGLFTSHLTYWQKQEIVAIARILATMNRMKDVVFCKDTALFLHGIPQKKISPNVYVRSAHAYGKHLVFPEVWIGNECILPEGKLLVSHAVPTHSEPCYVSDIPCVSLVQLLVECVAFKGDEEALASTSALLSSLARQGGMPREIGEAEVEKIRGQALLGVKTKEGFRGRQRAARIIEGASTKCDSIAEAYFVAMLVDQGISGWMQQYEVRTPSGWRFIDFAFPEMRVAIEIEGKVKDEIVGRATIEGHVAYYNRAAELSTLGWRVIPIPATDVLFNPLKARHTLHRVLAIPVVAA